MTTPANSSSRWTEPGLPLLLVILLALTVARIVGLHFSVVDLFFDEAQYWAWSRDLAFGYFSKPPLLAWIIAASDPICGSGEACIRMASPLFYCGTSLVVYAIANELYDKQTAFWSGLTVALLTGVSFSTRIISTDVPLLFFWALAVFAYLKLLAGPNWRWALLLGISLGFGLLAKYAMVYFALGMLCAAWLDRDARELLKRPQTWAAFAIAFFILSPNIVWNVLHRFVTFTHTGDNITGTGLGFRPLEGLIFFGSQFAVAGPLVFAAFLAILFQAFRNKLSRQDKLLLAFAVPPLALVFALSFFRSANANWAAPALLPMAIVVVAWWLRNGYRGWVVASLAIGVAAQAALLVGDVYANRISIAALGRYSDIYHRTLGWRALGTEVARLARDNGAPTVAAEDRAAVAALTYYLRNEPVSVTAWARGKNAGSQFDLAQPLTRSAKEPVLMLSGCTSEARFAGVFPNVKRLPNLTIRPGPKTERRYAVFALAGQVQRQAKIDPDPVPPLGPCKK
jgi:4-amino-4-deoxy-L-arabinose transferase-like glycosyltransferase